MSDQPGNGSKCESEKLDVLIIGAGPIGLCCALQAKSRGLKYLVIEKGCLANSLYHYPTNMRFFSTPDLLELGGVPFITQGEKPNRLEALEYYRRIATGLELNVNLYEQVTGVQGQDGDFAIESSRGAYRAAKVIAAIGFFDRPRMLDVPGEGLEKVSHYFSESHPYCNQDLLIVGSGNSAVEAALECYRHDVRVTLAVRGEDFHSGIKYWIRPDIDNRIQDQDIAAHFQTQIVEIQDGAVTLRTGDGEPFEIANDFVLALTGYQPNFEFLEAIGVKIQDDSFRTPLLEPKTWESNRPGLYLAGVVVGGLQTNEWFIENSRAHAEAIFGHMMNGG